MEQRQHIQCGGMCGQGTCALEIIAQMKAKGKEIDAVLVPVGGGGLLAGVAAVFKHLKPSVEVIVSKT